MRAEGCRSFPTRTLEPKFAGERTHQRGTALRSRGQPLFPSRKKAPVHIHTPAIAEAHNVMGLKRISKVPAPSSLRASGPEVPRPGLQCHNANWQTALVLVPAPDRVVFLAPILLRMVNACPGSSTKNPWCVVREGCLLHTIEQRTKPRTTLKLRLESF